MDNLFSSDMIFVHRVPDMVYEDVGIYTPPRYAAKMEFKHLPHPAPKNHE